MKTLKHLFKRNKDKIGPAEIWTRIAGFRVLSANHYTTGPGNYLQSILHFMNGGFQSKSAYADSLVDLYLRHDLSAKPL